jgi:hypothetical protein
VKVNSEATAARDLPGPLLARLVGALFELLIPANQVDVVVGD